MLSTLSAITSSTSSGDLSMSVTLLRDARVELVSFNRSDSAPIDLTIMATVSGFAVPLVADVAFSGLYVTVTPLCRLPAGALIEVETSGETSGSCGAMVILDEVDVLNTAMPELSATVDNPTLAQAAMLQYMRLRNAGRVTAYSRAICNAAGAVATSGSLSDDGTTFSQGKLSP